MDTKYCATDSYSCPNYVMGCAYVSMIYVISCVFYFIVTRCIGTPFLDSLTEEQKRLKKQSSQKRHNIFLIGIVVGIILLHIANPFSSSETDYRKL